MHCTFKEYFFETLTKLIPDKINPFQLYILFFLCRANRLIKE